MEDMKKMQIPGVARPGGFRSGPAGTVAASAAAAAGAADIVETDDGTGRPVRRSPSVVGQVGCGPPARMPEPAASGPRRRRQFCKTLFSIAVAGIPGIGIARPGYPLHVIKAVVGVPAGGTADVLARVVAPPMSVELGQKIIIDNRGGAGGVIAAGFVAGAAPDGYTLLFTSSGALTIDPHIHKSMPYDTFESFAPICLTSTGPFLLLASPALPAATIRDLIALAKKQPGKLDYGSGGYGTANHLAMVRFAHMTGIDIVHIPYKGAPETLIDLVSGRIALTFNSIGSALPLIKSGKARALAIAGTRRSPLLPDVPTMIESGLPGFEAGNWLGLLAPAGTPDQIIARLNQAAVKAVAGAQAHRQLEALGAEPVGDTPAEFAALIRKEWDLNRQVARLAGVAVD